MRAGQTGKKGWCLPDSEDGPMGPSNTVVLNPWVHYISAAVKFADPAKYFCKNHKYEVSSQLWLYENDPTTAGRRHWIDDDGVQFAATRPS
jgi:hypothetical protein